MYSKSILAYGTVIPPEVLKEASHLFSNQVISDISTKINADLKFIKGLEEADGDSFIYIKELAVCNEYNTGVSLDQNLFEYSETFHYHRISELFLDELRQRGFETYELPNFTWNLFSWTSGDN